MAGTSGTILCAAAAAVLATAAPARAQPDQEPLSAAAVEDFFGRMEQDAVRMVRSGAFEELLDWVTDNIAEEATFAVSETFHAADRPKGFAVLFLDRRDVLAFTRSAVGMMSAMPDGALQDYSLEIQVTEVIPAGPDAATATTRIVESGSFVLSGGGAPGSAAAADAAPVEMTATAECSHLVRRDAVADRLLLGMTHCQADIRL